MKSPSEIVDVPTPSRRWLQFSLRTALILMAVAAPLFAWLGYRLRQPTMPDAQLIEYLTRNASDDSRCAALLKNLGVSTSGGRSDRYAFRKKNLLFHWRYSRSDGSRRVAFIYDPTLKTSPGTNPETIIITDARYRLLAWKEVSRNVGGSLDSAALTYGKNGDPTLDLTRWRRLLRGRRTYRFSLDDDQVDEIGYVDVERNKVDEEALQESLSNSEDKVEEANAKRR